MFTVLLLAVAIYFAVISPVRYHYHIAGVLAAIALLPILLPSVWEYLLPRIRGNTSPGPPIDPTKDRSGATMSSLIRSPAMRSASYAPRIVNFN